MLPTKQTDKTNTSLLAPSFPLQAFNDNLIRTLNTLTDFVSVDEWEAMKIIFLNHVSKAFVTSSYFNGMSEQERIDAIDSLNILRHVLELLADLFTDAVHENGNELFRHLQRKLQEP